MNDSDRPYSAQCSVPEPPDLCTHAEALEILKHEFGGHANDLLYQLTVGNVKSIKLAGSNDRMVYRGPDTYELLDYNPE